MDSLTAQYGYASTGESFSITDPREVWVMDFIGRGPGARGAVWVARRVPDGYVGGHANQARICTFPRGSNDTLYSPDVVTFAKARGLYPEDGNDESFSFADVFDPLTPVGARSGEARVWDMFRHVAADAGFADRYLDYAQGRNLQNRMPLFVKVAKPLSLNQTMWIMRGHYEGSWFDQRNDFGATPFYTPYRVRPLGFKVHGEDYMFNRNVGYMGTFFHFVSHARGAQPAGVPTCAGGVTWFGVDDPSLSVNVPMYSCTRAAPETFAYGNGDAGTYAPRAAFWAFNMVANFAYSRWNLIGAEVQRRVADAEETCFFAVGETDTSAADMAKEGRAGPTIEKFLSNFSIGRANDAVDAWVSFFPELFVKYRDFLVVKPAPPPASPRDLPPPPEGNAVGYDSAWYEAVVAATGDRYRLPAVSDPRVEAHAATKFALMQRIAGEGGRRAPTSTQPGLSRRTLYA